MHFREGIALLKKIAPGQWLCLAAALVMFLLAAGAWYMDVLDVEGEAALIERHRQGVGMLGETPASQTFSVQENNLYAVDVMASNSNKKVKEGTLRLWLTDDAGQELARLEIPAADVKNNAFITLDLAQPQPDSAGRVYTLYASSDCVEQKGLTLRMGPLEAPADNLTLTLADGTVDTENALNMRVKYQQKAYGHMACTTLVLVGVSFAGCIPLARRKERTHG